MEWNSTDLLQAHNLPVLLLSLLEGRGALLGFVLAGEFLLSLLAVRLALVAPCAGQRVGAKERDGRVMPNDAVRNNERTRRRLHQSRPSLRDSCALCGAAPADGVPEIPLWECKLKWGPDDHNSSPFESRRSISDVRARAGRPGVPIPVEAAWSCMQQSVPADPLNLSKSESSWRFEQLERSEARSLPFSSDNRQRSRPAQLPSTPASTSPHAAPPANS